jgi:hypothetical protein
MDPVLFISSGLGRCSRGRLVLASGVRGGSSGMVVSDGQRSEDARVALVWKELVRNDLVMTFV